VAFSKSQLQPLLNIFNSPRVSVMRPYAAQIQNADLEKLSSHFTSPEYKLTLDDCFRLVQLPDKLDVPVISLRNCVALTSLPRGMRVVDLDASGCTTLRALPDDLGPVLGRLTLRGCEALRTLPTGLSVIAELDVSGCRALRSFPAGLLVTRWLEVSGTTLESLPQMAPGARLRWRGVEVQPDIVLHPETISTERVLREPNAELRRVLMERMGYERFVTDVGAQILDTDTDPGGKRELLRVELSDDEPLVVLSVRCPSTGRQYLLRVPPSTQRCHDAAAWIAGFDDPTQYAPLCET
jgi:hypothetical protein